MHNVQGIIGSKRALDSIQQRFELSRVVELKQGLYMLPINEEFFGALPGAKEDAIATEQFHFEFLGPKIISLLIEVSKEGAVIYFETDYWGGLGDQGVIAAEKGRIVFGPQSGDDSINSALRLLGVRKGTAHDEYDAMGLGRFRSTEDWIEPPSYD